MNLDDEFTKKWSDIWLNLGNEQFSVGAFASAVTSYNKALEMKPDEPKTWYNKGITLAKLGQYKEAIVSYDKAIKLKPNYYQSWYNRAMAMVNLEKYKDAITSYDKAIEIKPDSYQSWYNRGVLMDDLKQYEEAITSYNKAIELKPDLHLACFNRGKVLHYLERYEEAITSYDQSLKIKPNDENTWINRGSALHDLGQHEQALASYDKALELKPDSYEALCGKGVVLVELKKYKQGISFYDQALTIKSDEYKIWYNRGTALSYLGQQEDAIASYDKALKLKPDLHNAWYNRGKAAGNLAIYDALPSLLFALVQSNPALNKRGYEGALASYEVGLESCPQPEGQGILYRAIGNAHYFQGRKSLHPRTYWHKAVKSYNQALKTLTATDFPELHLKVLRDLINVRLHLRETAKIEELQRQGTDVLRRLLDECQSPGKKKQLALKFAGFQQFTVDLAVQSGNWCAALELAEKGKNACLSWLLDGWSEESPTLTEIQQLLNPNTAIIYWHLSPYALHTFILTHNHQPIILASSQSPAQRLQDFEKWAKTWNEEYSNYRKGKDKEGEKTTTWRDNLPAMLQRLGEILDIAAIVNVINNQERLNIQNLILIPHRDLHRFPLHALFPHNFTITYLPSAKIGITLKTLKSTNVEKIHELPLLSVEHPDSKGYSPLEFAQVESESISRMFSQHTRKSSEKATKAAVREALLQNRIFHFTGHGEYNFDHPTLSNLALAGEEKLTVEDIYNFDLTNYQLISLAACETAITGNRTITAEYVGLVSGFMAAGVRHVVSTLWTVESEATALVMIQFYQLLQQGKTAVEALAEATQWLRNIMVEDLAVWYAAEMAKLSEDEDIIRPFLSDHSEIIKNTPNLKYQPYNHPYFWAAFTITGNSL